MQMDETELYGVKNGFQNHAIKCLTTDEDPNYVVAFNSTL